MKYFFGLGNPGEKYSNTRHNVGQMLLQYLAGENSTFLEKKKLKSSVLQSSDSQSWYVKPTTYMNESGLAVFSFLSFFKVDVNSEKEQIFILYDDLDIELGIYKIQFGKGPKVHNGLNSVVSHLGTDQFTHIRIGVDGRGGQRQVPGKSYVLQPFSQDEMITVERVFAEIKEELFGK